MLQFKAQTVITLVWVTEFKAPLVLQKLTRDVNSDAKTLMSNHVHMSESSYIGETTK